MADASSPDFPQHMAEGDNIIRRRIAQVNAAAEQRIGQFNKNAEERIDQINNTLQQTVKKFDTVAEQRIYQIEYFIQSNTRTIYAQIAKFVADLKKILSTALFIFKIGMLFMLFLFLYGNVSSLLFAITAALVSTAAVYLEQHLNEHRVILIICTCGAVYVAMFFIMDSSAFRYRSRYW